MFYHLLFIARPEYGQ